MRPGARGGWMDVKTQGITYHYFFVARVKNHQLLDFNLSNA